MKLENNLFEDTFTEDNNETSDDNALIIDENIERKILWQAKDFSIRELMFMETDGTLIMKLFKLSCFS